MQRVLNDLAEKGIQRKPCARGIVGIAQLTEDLALTTYDGVQTHRRTEQVTGCRLTGLLDDGHTIPECSEYAITHPSQLVHVGRDGDVALNAMTGRKDDQVGA